MGHGERRIQSRQSECTTTQERTGSLIARIFGYVSIMSKQDTKNFITKCIKEKHTHNRLMVA